MLDSSLIVAALGASGRTGQGRPWATPQSRSGRRGSAGANASTAAPNSDNAIEDRAIEDRAIEDRAIEDRAIEDRAIEDRAIKDRAIKTEQVRTETTPRK
jgi:hypothetical protein